MTCHQDHEADIGLAEESMSTRATRRGPVARFLMGGVRLYQKYISPLSGPRCRFYPSCSSYAVTAIEKHGAVRGTGLAVWRLLRCNPWNDGGVDDVPDPRPRPGR